MVIAKQRRQSARGRTQQGMLMTELVVAMGILVIAILPIGYSLIDDARLLRAKAPVSLRAPGSTRTPIPASART